MTAHTSGIFTRDEMGFVRVAAITPELRVADVAFNTQAIIAALEQAAARGCRLALFPELCVTGYSCADLFYQSVLLREAGAALRPIADAAHRAGIAVVVGLPLEVDGRLFNCAAFLAGGRVIGVAPKSFLPNTNEYYEARWFSPAQHVTRGSVFVDGAETPFGADLLFEARNLSGCVIGIEICEELWAVNPPSGNMALAGATVLLNPSASNELLGKADYRRDLVRQQSARCLAAYVYAAAGPGESTTDVVFGGHSMIAENGTLLAEAERFRFDTQIVMADLDLQRLTAERLRNSSFSAAGDAHDYRALPFDLPDPLAGAEPADLLRPLTRRPFVPVDLVQRARHCREIFSIQSAGLAKRLRHTDVKTVTLGLSGGLDSTLALLVTIKAF
ncbi:MAG: nitrilase-related carbon-nitrogen hydrolase, partial [Candidatus Roseilinea sp.]|uniref:nitrilase-related carbon-nitrogen hydrolase n=1 Tax=Candidatus Roseilinea sp. TaxID=2838777 RepID=UPI00404B6FA7